MSDAPSSATTTPLPGQVLLGRYRLESLVRRGGMGSVWRAEHLQLKSPVAIKLLKPEIAQDPVMVQRFMREAQAAAALRSPNVVQILDHGIDAGRPFIAMEMLEGEPLSERIARLGRLAPDELFRFLGDVLRAMIKAHEAGIVHRDLKPDNVFICKDEPEFAKVLDFGVAKVKKGVLGDATGVGTQTGLMLGTPYYMSPEQAQAKALDQRTDLWSIAVIAYEALLGRRPFVAEALGDLVIAICTAPTPIPSRAGSVPPGFDEWFVRGTQRDPARRFQTAREMAEELEQLRSAPAGARAITAHSLVPAPVPSLPAVTPGRRTLPSRSAPADDLQLTTGQRSAVTRLSSEVPSSSMSFAMLALLALGALILVGVVAFAVGGGAQALHRAAMERGRSGVAPPAAPTLESFTARAEQAASAQASPEKPAAP